MNLRLPKLIGLVLIATFFTAACGQEAPTATPATAVSPIPTTEIVGPTPAMTPEPTPAAVSVASPTATTLPSEPPAPGLLQVYEDDTAAFSLRLPLDWVVGEAKEIPLGRRISLGSAPLSENDAANSTIIVADAQNTSTAQLVDYLLCEGCQPPSLEDVTLRNGIAAQRALIDAEDAPLLEWFFIEHNDYLIAMTIHDPATRETLAAIVHSFVPGPIVKMGGEAISAAQQARQDLAQKLGISPYAILLDSIESIEWRDACLGVQVADQNCLQVLTPGYRVVLEVAGRRYAYHTDGEGRTLQLIPGPAPQPGGATLTWQEEGGQCRNLVANPDGVLSGPCDGALVPGELAPQMTYDSETLQEFALQYMPFYAETAAGNVTLAGKGTAVATVDKHEEIARWLQSLAENLVPEAVLLTRQILAQQRHLDPDEVTIVSYEAVDWPDSCLGVAIGGMACARVVTPGYRIVLAVEGQQYTYHTDARAGIILLAEAPDPGTDDPAVIWQQDIDGICQTARIDDTNVAFGPCGGVLMTGLFASEQRARDLVEFRQTYAGFMASTAAGEMTFDGEGDRTATPAEQRMIAEWARLVVLEAAAGRSGASYGLLLAWHREGGIAGFCDDLTVYVTGDVYAASCPGQEPEDLGHMRLDADQLAQIYAWMDQFESFEYEETDPATADAMTIRLVFTGLGTTEPGPAEQRAMLEFASNLFAALE